MPNGADPLRPWPAAVTHDAALRVEHRVGDPGPALPVDGGPGAGRERRPALRGASSPRSVRPASARAARRPAPAVRSGSSPRPAAEPVRHHPPCTSHAGCPPRRPARPAHPDSTAPRWRCRRRSPRGRPRRSAWAGRRSARRVERLSPPGGDVVSSASISGRPTTTVTVHRVAGAEQHPGQHRGRADRVGAAEEGQHPGPAVGPAGGGPAGRAAVTVSRNSAYRPPASSRPAVRPVAGCRRTRPGCAPRRPRRPRRSSDPGRGRRPGPGCRRR